jgi:tubulin--tyrosine ligase
MPALCALRHGYSSNLFRRFPQSAEDEDPRYRVSYSDTSGTVFAALNAALLDLFPQWSCGPAPRALQAPQGGCRLPSVHLVLGDRYHMDVLIRDWSKLILRPSRAIKPALHTGDGMSAERHRGRAKHVFLVNYYSGTKELSLKSNMVRHLKAYLSHPWEVTPMTFIVKPNSRGVKDQRDHFNREFALTEQNHEGSLWIVKPARMNKAVGIRVMQDPDAILHYIDTHGEQGEWVVQKYIERPFLIHGRKFDIRTWVVVGTRYDVWLWQEGVLRTASERYDPFDLNNELAHLTNHCVQEKGPNFSKYESGNEMWYHQFQAYLDKYHPGYHFRDRVIPRIKAIIRACFQSIKTLVVHSARGMTHEMLCYQVFGFDFMMDDNFETWLIEINGQPALAEALLPDFTEDTIELIVKPTFGMPPSPEGHRFELVDPGDARASF